MSQHSEHTSATAEVGRRSHDLQTVNRVAAILQLFSSEQTQITPAVVAERLKLNRTTAHRYCTAMASAGILEREDEADGYSLGELMVRLGAFSMGQRRVLEIAAPIMADLAARTGATALLSLWGGTGPVVARVEEPRGQSVTVTVRVGTQLELRAAQSIVFLEFHDDQLAVNRLITALPRALVEEIEAGRHAARTKGVVSALSEMGTAGLASPVFGRYGICASLALVSTSLALVDSPESGMAEAALLSAAERITTEMNGCFEQHIQSSQSHRTP
ncbi:helix-turn-helix domain-containing protein [Rhodococcus rhodochrous]|uniref:Helix-turn-helix domain-containing protein n=1 Tax=Rhodococcus rhodochrous TaxID=1829 RepID=A0AAW4XQ65_RHORH|nr:helix-turn-helix domain-containing protein [Rhodococcus rhodochrous]MCD2114587.1 helix-turn-helix domain-containing protein [Rhodococcus rhodochrous]